MDVEKLKNILKDKKIYIGERNKNIVAICPICGDHPNPNKRGHLYISKDPSIPIYHCFINNCKGSIRSLIYKITASYNQANSVITKEEEQQVFEKKNVVVQHKVDKLILPELQKDPFKRKCEYIKNRLLWKTMDFSWFQHNMIFDIKKFIELNKYKNLGPLKDESLDFINVYQQRFVGFLSRQQSLLILRNTVPEDKIQFRKYKLQVNEFDLLDYIYFPGGNPKSNKIVLSEGVFDILGEMRANSLKIFNDVRLYASGQSFSYDSLLKSVCFDESLYKPDVVILSDKDKAFRKYNWFKRNAQHVLKSIKIYYNKGGKDFNVYPLQPILVTT